MYTRHEMLLHTTIPPTPQHPHSIHARGHSTKTRSGTGACAPILKSIVGQATARQLLDSQVSSQLVNQSAVRQPACPQPAHFRLLPQQCVWCTTSWGYKPTSQTHTTPCAPHLRFLQKAAAQQSADYACKRTQEPQAKKLNL